MSADPAMLGDSGYDRIPLDAYWTPPWCTEALLSAMPLRGLVWEPTCGRGDMVRSLRGRGYRVFASDVKQHGQLDFGFSQHDFFALSEAPPKVETVATNPPYNEAERFARHAIDLMAPRRGMVAMLFRSEFDSAARRRDLFEEQPFACKIVLTKRPRWDWWFRDKPKNGPRHNFAWFVWDHRHEGPPVMRWAP